MYLGASSFVAGLPELGHCVYKVQTVRRGEPSVENVRVSQVKGPTGTRFAGSELFVAKQHVAGGGIVHQRNKSGSRLLHAILQLGGGSEQTGVV